MDNISPQVVRNLCANKLVSNTFNWFSFFSYDSFTFTASVQIYQTRFIYQHRKKRPERRPARMFSASLLFSRTILWASAYCVAQRPMLQRDRSPQWIFGSIPDEKSLAVQTIGSNADGIWKCLAWQTIPADSLKPAFVWIKLTTRKFAWFHASRHQVIWSAKNV